MTDTSATFHWSPVPGAQSYTVQVRDPFGNWTIVGGGPTSDTTITALNLIPGTSYEWQVRANCGYSNYSPWTTSIAFSTTGTSACPPPDSLYTTNIGPTTATWNWNSAPGAVAYSVQWRYAGGVWITLPGGPWMLNGLAIGGLQPNTAYEWRVRSHCDPNIVGPWSNPVPFTTVLTGGGSNNDYCLNATELTVNSSCEMTATSSINATPSVPHPSGTCPTTGYKDVWFKFTMPSGPDPVVTIRTTAGSLADVVMEVYVGTNCGNLTYVSCEDNNDNGNMSYMPVITVTGYAGQTIYVRAWGKDGATGTFNICVFDYVSVDFVGQDLPDIFVEGEVLVDPVDVGVELKSEATDLELLVAPNPTRDWVTVRLNQQNDSQVNGLMITDLSGKLLYRQVFDQPRTLTFEEQLDVSGYAPGIYLVQLATSKGLLTEKISVIR